MGGGGSRGREVKETEKERRRRCRRQEVFWEAGGLEKGRQEEKRKGEGAACLLCVMECV